MTVHYAFRPGTKVETEDDGSLVITHPVAAFRLRRVTEPVRTMVAGMLDGHVPAVPARNLLSRLAPILKLLLLDDEGQPTLTVETMVAGPVHEPAELNASDPVKLSRFALLRTDEHGILLESPGSIRRVRPSGVEARALLTALDVPTSPAVIADRLGQPVEQTRRLLAHLVGTGLVGVDTGAGFPDDDPVLRQWEFHDLLFHARSRIGRHDYPFGGIFPFRGEIEPRPAIRPVHDGPVTVLPRPAADEVLSRDPRLLTVLEGRRSTRLHGSDPITLAQLGEFLYRVARVRAHTEPRPDHGMPYPATTRPYPTGGAGYDLELYLAVNRCAGLEPGIYHYDPAGHTLTLINAAESDRHRVVAVARVAAGNIPEPDILITLTSRFQRLGWKYKSLPYAATLKNVGVLYQTMYLVATAMNLGACGLGGGDSDLAAEVFGLDYLQESSVGEFLLGSLPEEPAPSVHQDWTPVNDPGWHEAAKLRLALRA